MYVGCMSKRGPGRDPESLLMDVWLAASFVHQLRGLTAELQGLLEDAQRNAAAADISQSTIASVAGVTRPRVSQIVASPSSTRPKTVGKRLQYISQNTVDALDAHGDGFAGQLLSSTLERPVTRWVPTVARRSHEWVEASGRSYGEVADPTEQEQADLRYWKVGAEIRAQRNPLVVAVDGTIRRIYEVAGWILEDGQSKHTALGGDVYTDESASRPGWLPAWWPAEFELGAELAPPTKWGAYTPARITPDGVIHRAAR